MKKLSKIFAVVLCLAMALSVLPMGASAATEKCVEFTVDSLGLESQNYTASTATVGGIGVEWIQLGNYGNGIQMRDSEKDGEWRTSMFWNTSALGSGITKIELSFNSNKMTYDNADAVIFTFGNAVKGDAYSTKLSTAAGVKTYTITPNANTYTYFYLEHDLGYTFYWDSIKVYYNEGATTPDQPEVTTNYYVTGNAEWLSGWTEYNEGGLMTKGEDGLYTKVYENVAAGNYELKVNIGNWSESWGNGDENYKFTVEATSTVTVIFDAEAKTVTAEVVANAVPTIPTDPAEIIDAAYALESGESLDYTATLTGEIVSIDTPYNTQYSNITVTIKVAGSEDQPIQCFRLTGEGADALAVGDTITVTGTLKNYNGTIEFDAGCTLDAVVKGEGEVPVAPEDPKEIVDAAYDLAEGESLPYNATLTGEIVSIDTEYSEDYGNITVTIAVEGCEDKPIQCFRLKGEGAETLAVGDIITVTGQIKNYSGTIEFVSGCTLDAVVKGEQNPGEGENPGTGDLSVAGLVVAMMAATAGVVVLKKKEF